MRTATNIPGATLLSPSDHTLIMIDFQSQMSFATKSIDAVHVAQQCRARIGGGRRIRCRDDTDHGRGKDASPARCTAK